MPIVCPTLATRLKPPGAAGFAAPPAAICAIRSWAAGPASSPSAPASELPVDFAAYHVEGSRGTWTPKLRPGSCRARNWSLTHLLSNPVGAPMLCTITR